jgi:PPM family protein phosphatase
MPDDDTFRPPSWCVDVASGSHPGQRRANNEDAVYVEPTKSRLVRARGLLCLVADGMGGHAAGEVASRLAVETVQARYYGSDTDSVVDALEDGIATANTEIERYTAAHPETQGMGCTLTAAVICGDELVIGHVGDSRAYLVRESKSRQLTADHSWVAQQVVAGVLTVEQAEHHPDRNVLLRALGHEPYAPADIYRRRLQAGDALVLCSDGLTCVVDDGEIGELVGQRQPQQAVSDLIDLANHRGAPDNVSVVVLRVTARAAAVPSLGRYSRLVSSGGVAGLLIVAALAFAHLAGSQETTVDAPLAALPRAPAALPLESGPATPSAATPRGAAVAGDQRVVIGEVSLKEDPTVSTLERAVRLRDGTQLQLMAPASGAAAIIEPGRVSDYVQVLSGEYEGRRGYVDRSRLGTPVNASDAGWPIP